MTNKYGKNDQKENAHCGKCYAEDQTLDMTGNEGAGRDNIK